jgi:hypothetical protein
MSRKYVIVAVVMLSLVAASQFVSLGRAKDDKSASAQTAAQASPATPEQPTAQGAGPGGGLTISVDKANLDNGGQVLVTGRAAPGVPVYLEVVNGNSVRSVYFDDRKPSPDTPPPYKLFLTHGIPAFYQIYLPADKAEALAKIPSTGSKFLYSQVLKDLGADMAYNAPAAIDIDAYQASFLASVLGSRGDPLPKLDPAEARRRSMQLTKARFREKGRLLVPGVETFPDGSYSALVKIPAGSAPGTYTIVAYAGHDRSSRATVENRIAFPMLYLENAGTSVNLFIPFLLSLVISIFGVLIGAGGGFILNPVLLAIFPALPHTVVAGTVTPTVLFSQGSGIYNYSKIRFINWKLGVALGLAMAAGGFIGPKLTELVTIEQYKSFFGYILIFLAVLMLWQTLPHVVAKNKKEQAILKEFRRRAEESAKAKG